MFNFLVVNIIKNIKGHSYMNCAKENGHKLKGPVAE